MPPPIANAHDHFFRVVFGRWLPRILGQLREQRTALGILRVVMEYVVQANDQVTEDDVAEALRAIGPDA